MSVFIPQETFDHHTSYNESFSIGDPLATPFQLDHFLDLSRHGEGTFDSRRIGIILRPISFLLKITIKLNLEHFIREPGYLLGTSPQTYRYSPPLPGVRVSLVRSNWVMPAEISYIDLFGSDHMQALLPSARRSDYHILYDNIYEPKLERTSSPFYEFPTVPPTPDPGAGYIFNNEYYLAPPIYDDLYFDASEGLLPITYSSHTTTSAIQNKLFLLFHTPDQAYTIDVHAELRWE